MSFDWSSLILFSGIVNAIVCVVVLLFLDRERHSKISFSILPILCCVIGILFERIIRFSNLETSYPKALFLSSPLFFFLLPLLYLFQKRLNGLSKYWYLHFILPVLALVALAPTIVMDDAEKLKMYHTEGLKDPVWIILVYLLIALGYSVGTFIENQKHRHLMLNETADNDLEGRLFSNKLVFISSVLVMSIPIALASQYLDIDVLLFNKTLFILFSFIPHLVLVALLFLNTSMYRTNSALLAKTDSSEKVRDLESIQSKLLNYMATHKPYLDQDLNLPTLADLVACSRSSLSLVINKNCNKNFYDFVNEYRLNHVLEELETGAHEEYTLDYIVSGAGFKNYVSFYRFFKKTLKKSPKAYIKALKSV